MPVGSRQFSVLDTSNSLADAPLVPYEMEARDCSSAAFDDSVIVVTPRQPFGFVLNNEIFDSLANVLAISGSTTATLLSTAGQLQVASSGGGSGTVSEFTGNASAAIASLATSNQIPSGFATCIATGGMIASNVMAISGSTAAAVLSTAGQLQVSSSFIVRDITVE
jgi:hypothetical protein